MGTATDSVGVNNTPQTTTTTQELRVCIQFLFFFRWIHIVKQWNRNKKKFFSFLCSLVNIVYSAYCRYASKKSIYTRTNISHAFFFYNIICRVNWSFSRNEIELVWLHNCISFFFFKCSNVLHLSSFHSYVANMIAP
jgi:hypothetical protein